MKKERNLNSAQPGDKEGLQPDTSTPRPIDDGWSLETGYEVTDEKVVTPDTLQTE
ncbi:MAG: hypothetical protein ACPGLV_06735 [Bacteroidia bacterium]